jgi:hypothetical protein
LTKGLQLKNRNMAGSAKAAKHVSSLYITMSMASAVAVFTSCLLAISKDSSGENRIGA